MPAGHRARRRFSQNFLHDVRYIDRIVAAIAPRPGQHIVEIGPGLGALTGRLVAGAGRIRCIEIDRDLAARLRASFAAPQLEVIERDALEIDWVSLGRSLGGALRIVGNLPYHVSTPLLFKLVPAASFVEDQHFMLQREVVDRMVAAPGGKDFGRLSVTLQLRYRMAKLFDVPAGAFTPVPRVISSVVRMQPRPVAELPEVELSLVERVVAAAFGQRRKTVRNALAPLLDETGIRAAGVDPGARAEQLPVAAFVDLARRVPAAAGTGDRASGNGS
ncbi:MAG TPA: 16S rRNA (adenine(1518)-N(6)/adenine(1519)-N(6))-dimethyltransferase RsmA [Burkholderiaceae bacterium]|nr:16S rRNA (adenine(1518)-N(6)/adenine(1519)-N(6))-dimethyltransferase RsmA [Burkholderiaceae bacterium]